MRPHVPPRPAARPSVRPARARRLPAAVAVVAVPALAAASVALTLDGAPAASPDPGRPKVEAAGPAAAGRTPAAGASLAAGGPAAGGGPDRGGAVTAVPVPGDLLLPGLALPGLVLPATVLPGGAVPGGAVPGAGRPAAGDPAAPRVTGIALEHHEGFDRLVLSLSAPVSSVQTRGGLAGLADCVTGRPSSLPGRRFAEIRLPGVTGHDAAGKRTFPQPETLQAPEPGVTGYALTCDDGRGVAVGVGVRGENVNVSTRTVAESAQVVVTFRH